MLTLHNVCSVHQGMFSTSGVFTTSGGTMSTSGGYLEYIGGGGGGCSVHRRIPWVHRGMFSTLEGYHEYIGGIS